MGNSSTGARINVQLESTKEQKDYNEANKFGHAPQIKTRKKKHKQTNNSSLVSLYPWLTYYKSLNNFCPASNTLQFIANIIYEYLGNTQIIKNKTFELCIYLNRPRTLTSNMILCNSSWNGLIYLISPINNNIRNANWYMIDEYNTKKSKQITMNEFPSYSLTFDTNLCCIISHIVKFNFNVFDMEYISNINEPMIIDGVILCNKQLNVIYGYSIIKRGLFIIKRFEETEPNLIYNYKTNKYEIKYLDGWVDEKIVNIWRQNLDCFVLTNKLNLFGVKITPKSFTIAKIHKFNKDFDDIDPYSDCWYDIKTKSLFVIYKYKTAKFKSIKFKIYKSENNKSFNLFIPKQLQLLLIKYYISSNKSFLFPHKPSNTLLLLFDFYIVQFQICFESVILNSLYIGKINEMDIMEINVINEIEHDGFKMNAAKVVFKQDYNKYSEDILSLMMKIKSFNKKNGNNNTSKRRKLSICDFIIGFDELRSCLIINLNEFKKELQTLYKFKIFVMAINDLEIKWRQLIAAKERFNDRTY